MSDEGKIWVQAMQINDQVIAILADQALLEPGDIAPEATLDDLGIDSMMLVETIFAIEEAFDITIPFNANHPQAGEFDISSVAAITAAVSDLVAAQKGA